MYHELNFSLLMILFGVSLLKENSFLAQRGYNGKSIDYLG